MAYWHDAGPFGAGTFYGCGEHAPDDATPIARAEQTAQNCGPGEFDPDDLPEGWSSIDAILRGLAAKAEGKPYDEDEILFAVMCSAAATLVAKGLDIDTAQRIVDRAMDKGDIHISWSEVGLSVEIGEGIVANAAGGSNERS